MEKIGRYVLGTVLGEGGAGKVYRAVLEGPGGFRKKVALKVLHSGSGALRREARIAGLLRHRHLVDVYEIGEADGSWFCAMELCHGSLRGYTPLPPKAVVEVGLAVCAALEYAQRALGLIHLDLKPDNLLVGPNGQIKVSDLGIARAEGFDEDGRVRGTPGYMPPEQSRGAPVDGRADIYALGVTLVQLATGVRVGVSQTLDPGSYGTMHEIPSETLNLDALNLHTEFRDEDAPLSAFLPDVPEWLAPVADRCLRTDPSERWNDWDAMAEALRALDAEGAGLHEAIGWTKPVEAPASRAHTNLPASPDAFVGRHPELAAMAEALAPSGCTTLKGAAGIGKSRLAAEAGRRWQARSGGQVWHCDLTEARDDNGLYFAVSRALDVRLGRRDGKQVLGQALARRGPLLLILDNFDPVRTLGSVARDWAEMAPEARIVVTSRSPLGLDDEHIVEVDPLDAPDSVALLIERARQRGVQLASTPELAELARRLDGVPLALELAAGRLGVLDVGDVLDRLEQGVLRTGDEGRHSTLAAALDWSWDALTPALQRGLGQLAVFSGGFTLEAAEAVVEGVTVVDAVRELIDSSMVRAEASGRFGMLSRVRAYAAEKLPDPDAELRHGQFWAQFGTEEAVEALETRGGAARRAALSRDLDNVVAACRRAISRSDGQTAAATLWASWAVMKLHGPWPVAARLATDVLSIDELTPMERAGAQRIAGMASQFIGRLDEAHTHYSQSLAAFEQLGAERLAATVHGSLGFLLSDLRKNEEAHAHFDAAMETHVRRGDRRREALLLGNLAAVAHEEARLADAERLYEQSLAIHRELGPHRVEGGACSNLGTLHFNLGNGDRALECYNLALARYREFDDRSGTAVVQCNLALLLARRGDLAEARNQLEEGLGVHRQLGNIRSEGLALGNLGDLHIRLGESAVAIACFEEASKIAHDLDDARIEGHWLGRMAAAEPENTEWATPILDRAEALLRLVDSSVLLAMLLTVRARVHWLAGAREQALSALREAEAQDLHGDPDAAAELEKIRATMGLT